MKLAPCTYAKAEVAYEAPGDLKPAIVTIGAYDIVHNGTFIYDDGGTGREGWDAGAGWDMSGTSAVATAAASSIIQEFDSEAYRTWKGRTTRLVSGRYYLIVFDVTAYTSGTITPYVGNQGGTGRTATGRYVECISALATANRVSFSGSGPFTGTLDNIKCWELFDEDENYHAVDWIAYSYEAAAPAGNLSIYGPDGQLFNMDILTNAPMPPLQFPNGLYGKQGHAVAVVLGAPSSDAGKLNVGYR